LARLLSEPRQRIVIAAMDAWIDVVPLSPLALAGHLL
jgi:hypothetical protein